MFCVLNVEKRKPAFIEKIFKFLQNDEYEIKTVPVFRGAPFYVLNAKIVNEIQWEIVAERVGKCGNRMLVSDKIKIPQENNIGQFKSQTLYEKVFQNTILQILRNNDFEINSQNIAVLDNSGNNMNFIIKLSKYASHFTIVTDKKEKYMDTCDEILNDSGLCVSLQNNFDNSRIKIDTERNIMSIQSGRDIYNISDGENISVEEIYKKILPLGICEYDFYSALYELCGVFSIGECAFENITVNNVKKNILDIHFA